MLLEHPSDAEEDVRYCCAVMDTSVDQDARIEKFV